MSYKRPADQPDIFTVDFSKRFEIAGAGTPLDIGLPEPIGLSDELCSDMGLMDDPKYMAIRDRLAKRSGPT